MEGFVELDEERLKRINLLKSSLEVVDYAISDFKEKRKYGENLHSSMKSESFSGVLPLQRKNTVQPLTENVKDESYVINSNAAQWSTCTLCFAEMEYSKVRKHMSSQCPQRKIECNDCKILIPYCEFSKHIAKYCEFAKRRKEMARQHMMKKEEKLLQARKELGELLENKLSLKAKLQTSTQQEALEQNMIQQQQNEISLQRPPSPPKSALCDLCGENIRIIDMHRHQTESCVGRVVYCPNRRLGCSEKLAVRDVDFHLQTTCVVEVHKLMLIEKSYKRLEPIKCPGCGKIFPLRFLRRHELEECENRRVHCKNHPFGCNYMVRLKERDKHEKVDDLNYTRYCLQLGGFGSHIDIHESDVKSDWTSEFWIFRPTYEDSARHHIRLLHYAIRDFCHCLCKEFIVGYHVKNYVMCLKSGRTFSMNTNVASMTLMDQKADRKNMMIELERLVAIYEEVIYVLTYHAQRLGKILTSILFSIEKFGGFDDVPISVAVSAKKEEKKRMIM